MVTAYYNHFAASLSHGIPPQPTTSQFGIMILVNKNTGAGKEKIKDMTTTVIPTINLPKHLPSDRLSLWLFLTKHVHHPLESATFKPCRPFPNGCECYER